jgi:NADH dehydrogenase
VILLTGGTGFVGRKIAHALRAEDRDVRCLVREPTRAETLSTWGCEVVRGDVTDAATLRRAVTGCDVVVHLVAIIAGRRSEFERVMTRGTHDLVAAAQDAGVRRFVLMSALGVSPETKELTPYYAAKWEMERAVKESGLEHVIFRPSFVFGRDGGVLPTFVRQVRWLPIIPVIGTGEHRLQPIWGEDVGAFFAKAVDLPGAANRTFELGGPDAVTWNELYERIAKALGKRRARVNIPTAVVRPAAALVERLPRPPITRDQVTMLEAGDSTCDIGPALETFRLELLSLDEQLRRVA